VPGRGLLTRGAVLGVQRAAGNRVAFRLVRDRAPARAAAPVVQRAPYGLDTPKRQGPYVDEAYRLWTTSKGVTLKDFATVLLKHVRTELTALQVPFFDWTFVTGAGASGVFDSRIWKIKINTAAFSERKPAPKLLGDLTVDELIEVVGTIYHESRHADQDVLIIRDLLAQRRKVPQIVAATKMPTRVVDAVRKATYPTPLDADQTAHARLMHDVMYGPHKQFLTFLVDHSDAVETLRKLGAGKATVSAMKPHVTTLTRWQTRGVRPHIAQIGKLPAPTAVETALRTRLGQVDAALTAFSAEWKNVAGAKQPAPAAVSAVQTRATSAHDAIGATYVELEGEADAFRVEEDVKDALDAKLNP
jgi:hypothetical protein